MIIDQDLYVRKLNKTKKNRETHALNVKFSTVMKWEFTPIYTNDIYKESLNYVCYMSTFVCVS